MAARAVAVARPDGSTRAGSHPTRVLFSESPIAVLSPRLSSLLLQSSPLLRVEPLPSRHLRRVAESPQGWTPSESLSLSLSAAPPVAAGTASGKRAGGAPLRQRRAGPSGAPASPRAATCPPFSPPCRSRETPVGTHSPGRRSAGRAEWQSQAPLISSGGSSPAGPLAPPQRTSGTAPRPRTCRASPRSTAATPQSATTTM